MFLRCLYILEVDIVFGVDEGVYPPIG